MPRVRVGMSPILVIAFLAIAAIDLHEYMDDRELSELVFAGVMVVLAGVYATATLLVIDGPTIEVRNPMGFSVKRYTFASAGDLSIDGSTLTVAGRGGRHEVSGMLANRRHWRALGAAIASAKAGAEPSEPRSPEPEARGPG
jgi:hypothetical protein